MVVDRTSSDRTCTGNKALSGHSDSKRKTWQKIPMSLSAQVASERLYFLPFREKHKKNKKQTKTICEPSNFKQKLVPYLVTFFPYISFLNKHFILHHKKNHCFNFSLNLQLSHFNNAHLLTSSFLSPSAFFSIEACLCYEKERKKKIKIKWIETASRLSHSQPKGIAYRTTIIYLLAITSILVQR